MLKRVLVWAALLVPFLRGYSQQERTVNPYSDLADEGCLPCIDTFQVLFLKKTFDIGRLLPEWKPVLAPDSVTVFEGKVVPMSDVHSSCHISPLDFSGYHYSHDLSFDAVPDSAYRHLLARMIHPRPNGKPDTLLQRAIHCEWESGIASGNESNPLAPEMRAGNSAGFLTAGHKRREFLWTLPSIGDWVHLEGQWLWDRGHPPARTEIHPIRFMCIVRNLPDFIPSSGAGEDSVFATKIDLFASGDGGALMNNRPGMPGHVQRVKMSAKDYEVTITPRLPQPALGAMLRWRWITHAGNTLESDPIAMPVLDEDGKLKLKVKVNWKGKPDDAIFAKTLYCWWDVPLGKSPGLRIYTYEIDLQGIDILMRKEGLSRSEWRFFTDIGGQWLFLNEFLPGDNILKDNLAQTYRKKWPIAIKLKVYVPQGIAFRIFAGGWEADGIDNCFGEILNPEAPCTRATKMALRKHLLPATPFGLSGCLDDVLGVAHHFPTPETLVERASFKINSTGHPEDYDVCPGKSGLQNDCFSFRYTSRRLATH